MTRPKKGQTSHDIDEEFPFGIKLSALVPSGSVGCSGLTEWPVSNANGIGGSGHAHPCNPSLTGLQETDMHKPQLERYLQCKIAGCVGNPCAVGYTFVIIVANMCLLLYILSYSWHCWDKFNIK